MSTSLIVLVTVGLLLALIALRAPIFVALGLAGLVGLFMAQGVIGLRQAPIAVIAQLQTYSLVAAPMYILMGEILAVSGLGRDVFAAAQRWFSRVRGGLGVSAVGASTVFGAMSGVSIASVAVVGRMAVPEMIDRGYKQSFATGSVVASGALAMLIPPSLMFILYSSVTGVSVSALFIGGLVPGLLLAGMMVAYVLIAAWLKPSLVGGVEQEPYSWSERFRSLGKVAPALALIIFVLGIIYSGIATATEAAGLGAFGALLIVGLVYRDLTWAKLQHALLDTARVSSAVLLIAASAFIFTQMLSVVRFTETVATFISDLDTSPYLVLIGLMVVMILMGCLVDAASLLLVITPLVVPALIGLGFDPLFIGVLMVVNLEMAVITPPVGLNLYTMKKVVPGLDIGEIFRGAVPFLLIEAALIGILMIFPELATALPGTIR